MGPVGDFGCCFAEFFEVPGSYPANLSIPSAVVQPLLCSIKA